MPVKLIPTDGHGDATNNKIKVSRKPIVPYVASGIITDYLRKRDRVLYQLYPYLRDQLKERWQGR